MEVVRLPKGDKAKKPKVIETICAMNSPRLVGTVQADSDAKPKFVCVEQSGFKYEFYFKSLDAPAEIHIFDEKGMSVDHLDVLHVKYESFETSPVTQQYTFVNKVGHEIAQVRFKKGSETGSGAMTDNDQSMKCSR